MCQPGEPVSSLATSLRLTALLLLLRPQGPASVVVAQLGLASVALLVPSALVAWPLWSAVTVAIALRIAWDWPLADNHIYLLAYWCLAITLALGATAPSSTLARTARLLVGGAMALAVIWKAVLSPDYVDGRFFRMTLIVDERFTDLVNLVGGMTRDDVARHRAALTPMPSGAELEPDETLVEPVAFQRLATTLTWVGLVWEASLAVVFLVPLSPTRRWMRHVLLLGFCLAVYPIAPVAGFGWLLLTMGLAAAGSDARDWTRPYLAVWLAVLAGTELPWLRWLATVFARG